MAFFVLYFFGTRELKVYKSLLSFTDSSLYITLLTMLTQLSKFSLIIMGARSQCSLNHFLKDNPDRRTRERDCSLVYLGIRGNVQSEYACELRYLKPVGAFRACTVRRGACGLLCVLGAWSEGRVAARLIKIW